MRASKDEIQRGTVLEARPNVTFLIELDESGKQVNAYLAGRLKQAFIKVLIGDRVEVFVPPQGGTGRITRRLKAHE